MFKEVGCLLHRLDFFRLGLPQGQPGRVVQSFLNTLLTARR